MRLVPTRRIAAGMCLGRDVTTGVPRAAPLLRAGVTLSERYRDALLDAGVHAVWIDDELGEGIVPLAPLSEETRREAEETTARALHDARSALGSGQPIADETLDELSRVAQLIAHDVAASPDAALALADLAAADAYTHRHSIDTTVVGLLVARRLFQESGWVDFRGRRSFSRLEERLAKLGLGLLLHDIGKLMVPLEVLNKRGRLEPDEWALLRHHPEAGLELLPDTRVSPLVRVVVGSHHERWDGGGYPKGLSGEEIHQFARIAAVADVYDAVTSERPYREAEPAHAGVRVIASGAGTLFDPEVVAVFRRVVMPYPPGSEIDLPDGRSGVVVSVEPNEPDRPLVRVARPGGHEELRVEMPLIASAA